MYAEVLRGFTALKVPLTPKMFFRLNKSTCFSDHFSEKINAIEKILAILQVFKLGISMFTSAQNGTWVGTTRDITSGTMDRAPRDFE